MYVRKIPHNSAYGLMIQKFTDDCNIYLAVNRCVMYGYIYGVIHLDIIVEIELESENKEGIVSAANWSMRDLLEQVVYTEKPLFRACASLRGTQ